MHGSIAPPRTGRALAGAGLASVVYWLFGLLCLTPHLLWPESFPPRAVAWGGVLVGLPTVGLLALGYLRWGTSRPHQIWFLSLALIVIHVPVDLLFISTYAPGLLEELSRLPGPLAYVEFILVPPLVAHFTEAPEGG